MKPEGGDLLLEHFYLYPAFQGRGLGAAVLQHLLVEADEAGQPIRLSVLQKSDAGRFYRRFGFVETSQDDFDIYLTRLPSKPSRPPGQRRLPTPSSLGRQRKRTYRTGRSSPASQSKWS